MAVCKSPLGDDKILVVGMDAVERISHPFRCSLALASEDHAIDFSKIIGKPIGVEVTFGDGDSRFFHGIVSRFAEDVQDDRFTYYQAEVVPELWLLTRRRNCRIFPEQSVPDILKTILGEHKITNVEYRFKAADYAPWNYCVQYRESDFDFISRILEEEGIYYYFAHEKDRHVLIFGDLPNHHEECAQAQVRMKPRTGGSPNVFWATAWRKEQELHPGKYALSDYNFLDPSTKLLVAAKSTIEIGSNDRFEVFDYPGRFVNVGAETDGKIEKGEKWVKVRMQEEAAKAVAFQGASESRHMTAGFKFELAEHANDKFNGKYLLTSVTHKLNQSGDFQPGTGEVSSYENTFECIAFATPFRPPRITPKPVIQGPQTAVVVGPEEIQIDEHARVKVLFHWDREGKKDGSKSSCWLRVSEHWAGKSWGSQFHPRVGQEVVVEFLEGDPDRPLVMGRVYNAEQTVHLPSPTQSGIMTRSSPEGTPENFNQIVFEDKKGEEEIYLHAERNLDTLIEKDETRNVGENQSITVGGNQTENVTKNVTVDVGGNRSETVKGDVTLSVTGKKTESVTQSKDVHVVGEYTEKLDKSMRLNVNDRRTVDIGKDSEEKVGGKMKLTVTKDYGMSVDGNTTWALEKQASTSVGGDYKVGAEGTVTVKSKGDVLIQSDASITLKAGAAKIVLKDGNVEITGGKVNVKGNDTVKVKGPTIGLN
jgi:type VI secretion system secreted protein VgrG